MVSEHQDTGKHEDDMLVTHDEFMREFADVLIDPADISFPRDSIGLPHILGKGSFGQVGKIIWTYRQNLRAREFIDGLCWTCHQPCNVCHIDAQSEW